MSAANPLVSYADWLNGATGPMGALRGLGVVLLTFLIALFVLVWLGGSAGPRQAWPVSAALGLFNGAVYWLAAGRKGRRPWLWSLGALFLPLVFLPLYGWLPGGKA